MNKLGNALSERDEPDETGDINARVEGLKVQPASAPKRCETNEVDTNGECCACGAIQGEACQQRRIEAATAIAPTPDAVRASRKAQQQKKHRR